MASRSLSDLDSRFRPLAQQVIDACHAVSVPVTVITTLRSLAEQKSAIAHHVSWTLKGMHLPQPPEGKSLAIDLCPTELLILAARLGATDYEKDWSPMHSDWWIIARAGVSLGLRSGMDWRGVGLPLVGVVRPDWDPGHIEYIVPSAVKVA